MQHTQTHTHTHTHTHKKKKKETTQLSYAQPTKRNSIGEAGQQGRGADEKSLEILLLLQALLYTTTRPPNKNERSEAVDTGGRDGTPCANGDGSRGRKRRETRKEGAQVGLRGLAVECVCSKRRGLRTRHQGGDTHRHRLQADHQDPTLQDPLQLEEEVWRRMQVRLPGLGGVRSGDGQEEQDRRAEASAHGCDLRLHRHRHQALWENPQAQAARRKEAKEGRQEARAHPNGLMRMFEDGKKRGGDKDVHCPISNTVPLCISCSFASRSL